MIAERGVEYHRLGYQAKLDYWQEVEIVMMIIMLMINLTIVMRMIIIMMMTLTIVIVIIIKTCLQVGGKPSRWPQILVTLAYAEKVALLIQFVGSFRSSLRCHHHHHNISATHAAHN